MHWVLIKGASRYGALELHIQAVSAALSGADHRVSVIDLDSLDFPAQLVSLLSNAPDAFFSFNGIGSDLQVNGVPAFDAARASYVSLYLDSPLYHLARLAAPAQRKAALFLDQTHVKLLQGWSGASAFAALSFLPPGSLFEGEVQGNFDDRDIDVLFTGTFRGSPVRPWLEWPEGPAKFLVDGVADRMASDGALPLQDALAAALKPLSLALDAERLNTLLPLLDGPQRFAEAYHRNAFVETLGAADVPVTVYGHGWDQVADRFRTFNYRGQGSFKQTLGLLPRARIVLNTNNGFVSGGHERVFTAMSAGAHVLTDRSAYYDRSFGENELTSFFWKKLADVPARIARLLADPDRLQSRAEAGARKARSHHQWANRVEALVKAARSC